MIDKDSYISELEGSIFQTQEDILSRIEDAKGIISQCETTSSLLADILDFVDTIYSNVQSMKNHDMSDKLYDDVSSSESDLRSLVKEINTAIQKVEEIESEISNIPYYEERIHTVKVSKPT